MVNISTNILITGLVFMVMTMINIISPESDDVIQRNPQLIDLKTFIKENTL